MSWWGILVKEERKGNTFMSGDVCAGQLQALAT
jgi:hypothetical protein